MEKNIIKDCTYANSCRECSTFTIDEQIDNAASMNIRWNETCNKTNKHSPETTVEIEIKNETLKLVFNQTRCCEGQRTLFFTGKSSDRPLPTGMYLISISYIYCKIYHHWTIRKWYVTICKTETETESRNRY